MPMTLWQRIAFRIDFALARRFGQKWQNKHGWGYHWRGRWYVEELHL